MRTIDRKSALNWSNTFREQKQPRRNREGRRGVVSRDNICETETGIQVRVLAISQPREGTVSRRNGGL